MWVWAKSRDGKEGWVPDSIITTDAPFRVTQTYSAQELTCQKGQTLTSHNTLHGWVFCTDEQGQSGWVPARNLA